MKRVISLIGCKGSGKDFTAQQYLDTGYVQIGMADLVREIVWAQLGWEPTDFASYENFKTTVFESTVFESLGESKIKTTGRDLLNGLTNKVIEASPDFWFEAWFGKVRKALEGGKNVVLTDMRYYPSVKYLKDVVHLEAEYKVIFCNYKSEKYGLQIGETEKMISDIMTEYPNIEHLEDVTNFFKERDF
jgi:hypothetical protein